MALQTLYKVEANGFVSSTNTSDFKPDDPVLQTPGILIAEVDKEGPLKIKVTDPFDDQEKVIDLFAGATINVAPDGSLEKDENGVYVGSLPAPAPFGVLDHIFLAMIKKGDIDLADVHPSVVKQLDVSLKHYGKETVTAQVNAAKLAKS